MSSVSSNDAESRAPAGTRILRWLGWLLLVAYFATGLAYLSLRYLVWPNTDYWLPKAEQALSRAIGRPIDVGTVRAGFDGLRPSLDVERLAIIDDDGSAALSAERVHATLSLTSLAVGELRFARLEVEAPTLRVERLAHRRLRIAGLVVDLDRPGSGQGLEWLFAQRRIVLRSAELQWIDRITQRELRLENTDLALGSVGRRHRAVLRVPQAPGLGEGFELGIELRRPALSATQDWRQWSGELHVAAERADLPAAATLVRELQLPDAVPLVRLQFDAGVSAFRLWTHFERGLPSDGLLRLAGRGLAMRVDDTALPLTGADFEAQLYRTRAGETQLQFRRLALRDDTGFELRAAADARQRVRIDSGGRFVGGSLTLTRFDSARLLAIAHALPLPESLRERFAPLRVDGTVERLNLDWDSSAALRYALDIHFDGLSFVRNEPAPRRGSLGLPSFENVSGSIVLDQSGGRLQVAGRKSVLRFPGLFAEPSIPLEVLDARARWRLVAGQDDGDREVDVEIGSFRFASPDAAGEVSGRYLSGGKGIGGVDLVGRLTHADASRVARYLPLAIGAEVRNWVARSVTAGRSDDVRFVLRGDLRDFPFRDPAAGEFRVEAAVRDVKLAYSPGWPEIERINGRLVFERAGMDIAVGTARLWDTTLGETRATIAEFDEPLLSIEGSSQGPAQDLLRFVGESPLRERIADSGSGLRAGGPAGLQLKIAMPLKDLDGTRVHGAIQLAGNDLAVDPALPRVEKISGVVQFTERTFALRDLAGTLLGGTIHAAGETAGAGSFQLRANGQISADGLRELADTPLTRALAGSTGWRASIELQGQTKVLAIESELTGLASTLPAPFAKPADAAWPLRVEVMSTAAAAAGARPQRELLRFTLRDDVRLNLERERDPRSGELRVRRGGFALGGAAPPMPESGVAMLLEAPSIDFDAWNAVIGPHEADGPFDLRASQVSLTAGRLRIGGKELNQVVLGASRSGDVWLANVRSRELDGHLNWRSALPGQLVGALTARFNRLEIPASRVGEVESLLDSAPQALPALDIAAEEFVLNDHRLGRLALKAENAGDRSAPVWRLEQLRIENADATLDARGDWRMPRAGRSRRTSLDFELALRDAGALLERLGYPGTMRAGAGSLKGNVAWTGSPLAIDNPSLSGNLSLELGRGNFLKTDPGIAKLIGVLNLQSLRRRLAFDFHDLFSEGFAFDRIHGTAAVKDGVARTEDFAMTGVTAQVRIRGEANIVEETQNLLVEVRPELNAGLASLAYAALVNPAIGLGSFVAQLLLREPLREMFAWEYEVTGAWADPQVATKKRPTLPEAELPQGG